MKQTRAQREGEAQAKAAIIVTSQERVWSDCPEHGSQREYTVTLIQQTPPNFCFMLRECSVSQGIAEGIIAVPETVSLEYPIPAGGKKS